MADAPNLKSFNCTACGAPQTIRGLGQTSTFACCNCGAIIDISNEEYKILEKYLSGAGVKSPPIAFGTRGKFFDTQYEVIGYMVRVDSSGGYPWEEFLLFNPYQGFAWLVNFNGHWNFVKTLTEQVERTIGGVYFLGKKFSHFLSDSATVQYVLGEFYWQIKFGDRVSTEDLISPPYILSSENDGQETVWSHGQYMTPEEVQQAFGMKDSFPEPEGIGASQPNPHTAGMRSMWKIAAAFFLVLMVLHALCSNSVSRKLFALSYTAPTGRAAGPFVTDEFYVTEKVSNVEARISASVNNDWLFANVTLINTATQDDDEKGIDVSYYHGSDSDGAWSEGGLTGTALCSGVEPGSYKMTIETEVGDTINPVPFTLVVTQGVPYMTNLLAALFAIFIVPVLKTFRSMAFESKRWANSDIGGGDDDDDS